MDLRLSSRGLQSFKRARDCQSCAAQRRGGRTDAVDCIARKAASERHRAKPRLELFSALRITGESGPEEYRYDCQSRQERKCLVRSHPLYSNCFNCRNDAPKDCLNSHSCQRKNWSFLNVGLRVGNEPGPDLSSSTTKT